MVKEWMTIRLHFSPTERDQIDRVATAGWIDIPVLCKGIILEAAALEDPDIVADISRLKSAIYAVRDQVFDDQVVALERLRNIPGGASNAG